MDPNATLAELREMVAAAYAGRSVDIDRFAELFDALDGWICKDGLLPRAWY